jgi:hypothetical protein
MHWGCVSPIKRSTLLRENEIGVKVSAVSGYEIRSRGGEIRRDRKNQKKYRIQIEKRRRRRRKK